MYFLENHIIFVYILKKIKKKIMENNTLIIKKKLRVEAKILRNILNIDDISDKIVNIIERQDFYAKALNILSFYPMDTEINLTKLYFDKSKNWFLPRVDMKNKILHIYPYLNDKLEKSKWGVLEPIFNENPTDPKNIDLAILPALIADEHGFRLGYGAGFYDKFLPQLKDDCLKVVPIPQELFFKELPSDEWDKKVDIIVTQSKVYYVNEKFKEKYLTEKF